MHEFWNASVRPFAASLRERPPSTGADILIQTPGLVALLKRVMIMNSSSVFVHQQQVAIILRKVSTIASQT